MSSTAVVRRGATIAAALLLSVGLGVVICRTATQPSRAERPFERVPSKWLPSASSTSGAVLERATDGLKRATGLEEACERLASDVAVPEQARWKPVSVWTGGSQLPDSDSLMVLEYPESVLVTIARWPAGRFDTETFVSEAEGYGGDDHVNRSIAGETVLAWETADPGYVVEGDAAIPQTGQLREEAILMWWDESDNTSYMITQLGGRTSDLEPMMYSVISSVHAAGVSE